MNIKTIKGLSSRPLDKVSGTNDWYFSSEWTGDIYEAEEIISDGKEFELIWPENVSFIVDGICQYSCHINNIF